MKNTLKILKKVWLFLLSMVLVFGLAILGCDNGDNGKNGDDDDPFTSDLSGKTLQLIKNEHSDGKDISKGLQGCFRDPDMMQGKKIKKGDIFKLSIKFKLDKALDDGLWVALVDMSPEVNYWKFLAGSESGGMYCIPQTFLSQENTLIEQEIWLFASESATNNNVEANTLIFDCQDLWSKAPVTITFVSFTFTKVIPSSGDAGGSGGGSDSGGSRGLTITGLGSYNDKYAIAMDMDIDLLAAASVDFANEIATGGKISGGSVTLKVFKFSESSEYKGNDTANIGVLILSVAEYDGMSLTNVVGYGNPVPVTFSNGTASLAAVITAGVPEE